MIESLKLEQAIIFCRTNVDCDNLEKYLTAAGGGQAFRRGMEKGKENKYVAQTGRKPSFQERIQPTTLF